jgi:peptidoglycan hydrolase-like protein with peptidoglycan-binding domain
VPELHRALPVRARLGAVLALVAFASVLASPARAQEPRAPLAAVQAALGVPADGVDGPVTRRAVRRFQRKHDLRATGVADAPTLAKLGITTAAAPAAAPAPAALARIAQCESGGNPAAVSANGRYRGKYQFSRATWRSLGGTGDPAAAPEAEQDARAAALYAREGVRPWPTCGQTA